MLVASGRRTRPPCRTLSSMTRLQRTLLCLLFRLRLLAQTLSLLPLLLSPQPLPLSVRMPPPLLLLWLVVLLPSLLPPPPYPLLLLSTRLLEVLPPPLHPPLLHPPPPFPPSLYPTPPHRQLVSRLVVLPPSTRLSPTRPCPLPTTLPRRTLPRSICSRNHLRARHLACLLFTHLSLLGTLLTIPGLLDCCLFYYFLFLICPLFHRHLFFHLILLLHFFLSGSAPPPFMHHGTVGAAVTIQTPLLCSSPTTTATVAAPGGSPVDFRFFNNTTFGHVRVASRHAITAGGRVILYSTTL